jgi:hypothetical protein
MAQNAAKPRAGGANSTTHLDCGPLSEQIAALAYSLWQERGCPEGTAQEDWFRAEQEVQAKQESQSEIVSTLTRVRRNRRISQAAQAS